MDRRIRNVLESLQRWHESPTDIAADMKTASGLEADDLPPPQVTWLLIGLIEYRRRKKWAWSVFEQYRAAAGNPSVEHLLQQTDLKFVPDRPEWSFVLGGNDSYVANRATGEVIHFDPFNDPEWIPVYWHRRYLRRFRTPGPAERRLNSLFPRCRGILAGFNYLATHRAFKTYVQPHTYGMSFMLRVEAVRCSEAVTAFLNAWSIPDNRIQLGSLIGDWDAVRAAAESTNQRETATRASELAGDVRERWLTRLRKFMEITACDDALYALAVAQAPDLPDYLASAMNDPELAGPAIRIVRADPTWRSQVAEVLHRSFREHWGPGIRGAAASYLARHGHPIDELLDELLRRPVAHRAAMQIALQYAPKRLPELLRRGLRSSIWSARLLAAAILADVDNEWSCHELMCALQDCAEQQFTMETRCALRDSRFPEACEAVRRWEEEHGEDDPKMSLLYRRDGGCQDALHKMIGKVSGKTGRFRQFLADDKNG